MDNSILTSIKKLLGIQEEYTQFDPDVIMHINTVLSTLNQLGVGPPDGFHIIDKESTWSDYLQADEQNFEDVKTYIYLKVKMIFDPPTSASVIQAYKSTIDELEWRIHIKVETNKKETEDSENDDL